MPKSARKKPFNYDEVLKKARQGDSSAFDELYLFHKKHVYNVCLRIIRNPDLAEDLTQDAFLNAFANLGTFRGDAQFETWLHHIATNVTMTWMRKKKNKVANHDSLTEFTERGDGRFDREIAVVDRHQMLSVNRLTYEKAFVSLRPYHRTILYMYHVDGSSYAEIAAKLGIPLSTLKTRMRSARKSLHSLLGV